MICSALDLSRVPTCDVVGRNALARPVQTLPLELTEQSKDESASENDSKAIDEALNECCKELSVEGK